MKEEKEYFTINEVSEITKIKPYVLRFWEKEFKELSPHRTKSHRRKYAKKHIDLILKIKKLRYEDGLTLNGIKKYLLNERKNKSKQLDLELHQTVSAVELLKRIKRELNELYNSLTKK